LSYDGLRSVVVLGAGVEWSAGCDATVRFWVSVETDFSRSQAKAGAAAVARSTAAANRRVISRSPEGRLLADWQGMVLPAGASRGRRFGASVVAGRLSYETRPSLSVGSPHNSQGSRSGLKSSAVIVYGARPTGTALTTLRVGPSIIERSALSLFVT
jgi:hypothetical protein